MIRFILTLAIALLAVLPGVCRDNGDRALDAIFDEYRHTDGADYVYINPFFTKLISLGTITSSCHGITGNLKSVRVLSIDSASDHTRRGLAGRISSLTSSGYEELIRVSDNGEKVRILARMDRKKPDTARRLLIFAEENGECDVVCIDGKFSRDDLARIISENQ